MFSLTVALPLLRLDVVPLFILKDEFIYIKRNNINVHNKLQSCTMYCTENDSIK
jgi:hypothetical protein